MSGSSLGADNKHCFALVQYAVMLQRKVLHIRTHRINNINVLFTVPLRMLCYFGPSRETTPDMIWYLNKLSQLETKATFKLLNSDLSLWCVFFCLFGCVLSSTDRLSEKKNNCASRNITREQGVVTGDEKEKTERKSFNNGFLHYLNLVWCKWAIICHLPRWLGFQNKSLLTKSSHVVKFELTVSEVLEWSRFG